MPTARLDDRAFGLACAGAAALWALIAWLLSDRVLSAAVALSGVLLLLALVVPGLFLPLNRLWAQLGQRLGILSNYALLGAFFYLVLVPVGLVARCLGRTAMLRRPDPGATSYWTPVRRRALPDSYPDLF